MFYRLSVSMGSLKEFMKAKWKINVFHNVINSTLFSNQFSNLKQHFVKYHAINNPRVSVFNVFMIKEKQTINMDIFDDYYSWLFQWLTLTVRVSC